MNSRAVEDLDKHITGNYGEDQFKDEAVREKRAVRVPKWFKWTVELQVDSTWVADGFDLDNERAHEMLAKYISHAYNTELKARVLTKPARKLIRKAQGY